MRSNCAGIASCFLGASTLLGTRQLLLQRSQRPRVLEMVHIYKCSISKGWIAFELDSPNFKLLD